MLIVKKQGEDGRYPLVTPVLYLEVLGPWYALSLCFHLLTPHLRPRP